MPYTEREKLTYRQVLEALSEREGLHHTALAFKIEKPGRRDTAQDSFAFVRAVESALRALAKGGLAVGRVEGGTEMWRRTVAGSEALQAGKGRRR